MYGTGDGGSFRALLTLLKSPEEATRLLALKMIGIFLNGNKTSTAYFNKNSGFDMISLLLAPFPVTLHTLQVRTVSKPVVNVLGFAKPQPG